MLLCGPSLMTFTSSQRMRSGPQCLILERVLTANTSKMMRATNTRKPRTIAMACRNHRTSASVCWNDCKETNLSAGSPAFCDVSHSARGWAWSSVQTSLFQARRVNVELNLYTWLRNTGTKILAAWLQLIIKGYGHQKLEELIKVFF